MKPRSLRRIDVYHQLASDPALDVTCPKFGRVRMVGRGRFYGSPTTLVLALALVAQQRRTDPLRVLSITTVYIRSVDAGPIGLDSIWAQRQKVWRVLAVG